MSILVFRHVPFEHLGLIAPALAAQGLDFEYVDLPTSPEAPADTEAAQGVVVMGGPMSANDGFPWLARELDLIRLALAAGRPVLGVCLGAQLIAKALGAAVYRNAVKEIGWEPVHWTAEAANDVLLAGLRQPETVFHWHGETFDLPRGAVHLGWTEGCRNQAFRWGERAWGLQFHLEVTPEMISAWCQEDANEGDVRELQSPLDPYANAARLQEVSALVFGRWARLCAGG